MEGSIALMKKAYTINWNCNTIIVTKKFLEAANHIGTEAYEIMLELRGLGMRIQTNEAPSRKACSTRLTYQKMLAYINCLENAEHYRMEFNAIRKCSLSESNPYQFVRNWFEQNFPYHGDLPQFNADYQIVISSTNLKIQKDVEAGKVNAQNDAENAENTISKLAEEPTENTAKTQLPEQEDTADQTEQNTVAA